MRSSFSAAIVVGASTGIGEALVRRLSAEGVTVVAVARREAELARVAQACAGRVVPLVHDVTRFDEVPEVFARAVAAVGEVDLVVYNAGVMPDVGADEYDFAKDRATIEVNLLGAMAWLDVAAAYMQARARGTLCGISSVAGDRGRRLNPAYHTSKAGLTTYLESLRNRLAPRGVTVVTVKPGPVRTAMTQGRPLPLLIDADACAAGALALMRAGTAEGYVPAVWGPIMAVVRAIPSVVFRRLAF